MNKKVKGKGPISLLRSAVNTLFSNPIILYPFFILAFIQILFLEIVYFAPRYPLSAIFAPIIIKTAGPAFMHYPYNYLLLPRWFGSLQVIIYLFVSGIFYGMAVLIIAQINNGQQINIKKILQKVLKSYLHLSVAMLLTILVLQSLSFLFGLVIKRAIMIKSTTGLFFLIKQCILISEPYVQLLFACLVSALFAFLIPLIVIEGKKIFAAVRLNFQKFGGSFFLIFCISLLTGLLYLPIILLKSANFMEGDIASPEMYGMLMVVSVILMLLIDAILYTAITMQYLLKKEE